MIKLLNPNNTLIDFDSTNGVIEDKQVGSVVGDDLVTNGDMSSDPTSYWTASAGTLSWVDTSYLRVTATGGTLGIYKTLLTANKKYKVLFKAKSSNLPKAFTSIGDLNNTATTISNPTLTASWQQYHFDIIPTGTIMRFYITSPDVNDVIDFDDISITELRSDLTITDTTIQKTGNGYAAKFNGGGAGTSKIDLGSDVIGVKAVTVMGWIKPSGWGEGSLGRIIDNGKFYMFTFNNHDYIGLTSAGSQPIYSSSNSISLNNWQFVSVTRTAAGLVTFRIGDNNGNMAISGAEGQDSGTPIAGTTSVIIGNNSGATRTFDGLIGEILTVEGILSDAQITRYYTSTIGKYK